MPVGNKHSRLQRPGRHNVPGLRRVTGLRIMAGPRSAANRLALVAVLSAMVACAASGATPGLGEVQRTEPTQPGFLEVDGVAHANPFIDLELWPLRLDATELPIRIRYQSAREAATAAEVLHILERSWRVHVDELAFAPPLAYAPEKDGRFTAFLWRDTGLCTSVAANRASAPEWEAFETFLVLDPWGICGDALDVNVAHAFHQAVTTAYDPREFVSFQVASATYAEDAVFDESNRYMERLSDFQAQPERSLGWDEELASWYAYGVSLYLFFLSERYFPDDPTFLARLWEASKGPRLDGLIWDSPDPTAENPNWIWALRDVLPSSTTIQATLAEFAVWRYFTGARAVCAGFSEVSLFPLSASVNATVVDVSEAPQIRAHVAAGGSRYYLLTVPSDEAGRPSAQFVGDPSMRWVVQQVDLGTCEAEPLTDRVEMHTRPQVLVIVSGFPRAIHDLRGEAVYEFELSIGR